MKDYNATTLALIDFKIGECVSKKEYYEKRLIQLYESREDIIAQLEPVECECNCKGECDE